MKNIKINLLLKDFVGNDYESVKDCPLARACNRKFKGEATVDPFTVDIRRKNSFTKHYKIKELFLHEDYLFVKKQYKNPKCDTVYQVTLITE